MKHIFSLTALFSLLLLAACSDDTVTIGPGVMPGGDNIETSQASYAVTSKTIKVDSVLANTNTCLLGCIIDPETQAKTTSDFLAQYHIREQLTFPKLEQITKDASGPKADSCKLVLAFDSFYGDSLTVMKLKVQELSKTNTLDESKNYYTNLNPQAFLSSSGGLQKTITYTVKDLLVKPGTKKKSHAINIGLPQDYGSTILKQYYAHPEYFKDSYSFIHNVCPGFYFQSVGGVGSMINVRISALEVYFSYKAKTTAGKDTIMSGMQRMAATEEVIQSTHVDNSIPAAMLNASNPYSYVKSPAGLFTEVTLPVSEVVAGVHYKDIINTASISFSRYNNTSTPGYKLNPAPTLLMVRKSEMFSFFEEGKLTNAENSYLADYNSAYNTYSFTNISQLITALKLERDKGAGVTESDTEVQRQAKYQTWEAAHPDWNKVMLIPVATEYSLTQNQNTGETVKTLLRVRNELGLTSVKLNGGNNNSVKMSVVYSKFSN